MITLQWKKIVIILAILLICDCKKYNITKDCSQEKCCSCQPTNCMTLSEYALNVSNYTNNNLKLSPGKHCLNSTLSINRSSTNTQDFSIIGSGSETTSIICTQNATFNANGLSSLTIENVSFVSCGVDTTPGVSLNNIGTVSLTDTRFSKSTSGALNIQNCYNVSLTSLKITNNVNSQHTIAFVKNSTNIILKDLRVKNNCIGKLDSCKTMTNEKKEVVFKIETCHSLNGEDIQVKDNTSPFGVMVIKSTQGNATGNWTFDNNQVCEGGSLGFVETDSLNLNGILVFNNNNMTDNTIEHTAGLFQNNSVLNTQNGSVMFTGNDGFIACFLLIDSKLNILEGDLTIRNSLRTSQRAGSLKRNSVLMVCENGHLNVNDNKCIGSIVKSESSTIVSNGQTIVTNNVKTPFSVFNSKVNLTGNITFSNNAGIMYGSNSNLRVDGNDSCFVGNDMDDQYTSGALAIRQSTLIMEGTYTFRDCHYDDKNGGGIFASATSTVKLGGTGNFMNNTAKNGGGIYLDELSSLELKNDTQLYFTKNKAYKGAAIFFSTSLNYSQCTSSGKTDCLFRGYNSDSNVSLTFQDNTASPGASVIHVNFDYIEGNDHIEGNDMSYKTLEHLNRSSTVNGSTLSNNSSPKYASDFYWFCFCEDDSRENCTRNNKPKTISAYQGKKISVKARVRRFYGSEMPEPVRSSLESSIMSTMPSNAYLFLNDGRPLSVSDTECSDFSISIKSTAESETLVMNVGDSNLDEDKTLKIKLFFNLSCPVGFPLNKENNSCDCDGNIQKHLQSCEITQGLFIKRPDSINYWMAPSSDTDHQGAMNWYENCPNRYCITHGNFTFSEDGICDNDRTGLLCGECKANYSLLLGGDRCGDCSNNAYLALILVFALAGVLLIAFIFLIQITVTTGTINGLIFYVNVLHSNQSLFFPKGSLTGDYYHIFISWLNLNFGIETCFYSGMNQLEYSGLQFVFPLYLWFLAGVVIVICCCSTRISRYFGSSDPVAVLATIILLSFNSLAQNIIGIYSLSSIHLPDNSNMIVWRYDGNVLYARDEHLPLLIVSGVFLLLFLIPYTLGLLTAPLLQKSERISKILHKLKLQPFIHSYLVPFKPQHRYWVGLCLFMRVMLLIAFAVGGMRYLNLFLIIAACFIAISMFVISGGIYDKKWIDKLELSFLINLGVLAATTSYTTSRAYTSRAYTSRAYTSRAYTLDYSVEEGQQIATCVSITLALFMFIGIIILHVFWRLKKFRRVDKVIQSIEKKLKSFKKRILNREESVNAKNKDYAVKFSKTSSTTVQIDLREPLLESLVK